MSDVDGSSESLAQFVAREARTASDGVLAGTGILGVAITAGMLYWRLRAWPVFTAAGVMLLALAAWGVLDRELAERSVGDHARHRVLRAARSCAAFTGWLAMLGCIFGLLGVALGTIIS